MIDAKALDNVDNGESRGYYLTVDSIKQVLIITDGTPGLEAAVESMKKSTDDVLFAVRLAADFTPTDLLPADAFFFGCGSARPASFAELERVLKGINLAGRPCGLFSLASQEAIEYLRSIVRDAEFRLQPKPFLVSGKADIGTWAAETLRLR